MRSSPFAALPPSAIDPIFAIAADAKAAGPQAIDATVGVILNESGKPHVFECVRKAAAEWAAGFASGDFSYPPLLGVPAFRESVTKLIVGGSCDRLATIATTGGTGAVAIHLKMLKLLGITSVVLPVPTWPNHKRLLSGFGMKAIEVPYIRDGAPDVTAIVEAMSAKEPHGVLLQVCCHNPTGLDFSMDQWKELVDAFEHSPHVPLLDCAYQGLGSGIADDVAPVRMFLDRKLPFLLAWSASKNHSIYGLRTGLACVAAADAAERDTLEKHLMILTREMHSSAPTAGQHIVAGVQMRHAEEWATEIAAMRELMNRKRVLIAEAHPSFASARNGHGMFAMLPLTPAHIAALRARKIFLTDDGRINIAGIALGRMDECVEALSKLLMTQ